MPTPTTTQTTTRWSLPTRILFRLAFCFFTQFALCRGNGTIWRVFPLIGHVLDILLSTPYILAGHLIAVRFFHITGPGATLHSSGYSDRAVDWFAVLLMLALSIIATGIWSILDRRRTQYTTLLRWLRFLLRLTLAIAMLNYGAWKIFPVQMPPPSLAVLNQTVGNLSPMTYLWTMVGINPAYEQLMGVIEFAAGLLLLYRRTELLGTLLALVALGNVLALNSFFDVPVKIYACCLLLMALLVMAPDLRALYDLFILHRPAVLPPNHTPIVFGWRSRLALIIFEVALFLNVGVHATYTHYLQYRADQRILHHPSPLAGIWHIESNSTWLTGFDSPVSDIVLEPDGHLNLRAADNTLWTGAKYVPNDPTLNIANFGVPPRTYRLTQPDSTHLTLTPTDTTPTGDLQLTRIPTPAHYPLLERGFHFANEWGYQ